MSRAFIAGIAGFTGGHLARYLLDRNEEVVGFDQKVPRSSDLAEHIPVYTGDICDRITLKRILAEVKPDTIYHLVGVLKSASAETFYKVNVLGTMCLLESVVELGIAPKVLVTSSSAVYGMGSAKRPITEQFKLRPMTHYAASKAAQETVAYRYYLSHKLPIVRVRAFNLIGPGQSSALACSAFARQIALAERSADPDTIYTGDLSAQRDFADVRDAVRAYESLMRLGRPGLVYNVCSGEAVPLQQCLDILLEMAHVPLVTCVDTARLQPNDVPIQVGSAARLLKHTGWKPQISLRQSLADLLDCWRQELAAQC